MGRYVALTSYNLRGLIHGGGDYFRFLHNTATPEWESVLRAFDEGKQLASTARAPVLLLIFPEPPVEGWEAYQYGAIHEQVAAAARARGFEVIDLLPAFRAHDSRLLRLDQTDHHPTPLAHEIAAEALLEPVSRLLRSADPLDPT